MYVWGGGNWGLEGGSGTNPRGMLQISSDGNEGSYNC